MFRTDIELSYNRTITTKMEFLAKLPILICIALLAPLMVLYVNIFISCIIASFIQIESLGPSSVTLEYGSYGSPAQYSITSHDNTMRYVTTYYGQKGITDNVYICQAYDIASDNIKVLKNNLVRKLAKNILYFEMGFGFIFTLIVDR